MIAPRAERARRSAAAALLLALLAAALNLHLLDLAPLTPRCAEASTAPHPALFSLPLGLWAAALYLTGACLAAGALRRPESPRGALIPHLLLIFAALGLAIAVALARTDSAPGLSQRALYGAGLLHLLAAVLLRLSTPPRRHKLRLRALASIDAIVAALALLLTAIGLLSLAYQQRRAAAPAPACAALSHLSELPATSLRLGAEDPELLAAYFLDPACPRSRAEFRGLIGLLGAPTVAARVQLRLYHFPREAGGCAPGELPLRFAAFSPLATEHHACRAALAIECVERLAPGLGVPMFGAAFDLQDTPRPYFTPQKLALAAQRIGLRLDPEDPQNPLFRCMSGDLELHRRLRDHLRFAADHGPPESPHGYLIGVTGGRLDLTHAQAFRGPQSEQQLRSRLSRE